MSDIDVKKTNDPNCPTKVTSVIKTEGKGMTGDTKTTTTICAKDGAVVGATQVTEEDRGMIRVAADKAMGRTANSSSKAAENTVDLAALITKDIERTLNNAGVFHVKGKDIPEKQTITDVRAQNGIQVAQR